jgi:hypothetical protein
MNTLESNIEYRKTLYCNPHTPQWLKDANKRALRDLYRQKYQNIRWALDDMWYVEQEAKYGNRR